MQVQFCVKRPRVGFSPVCGCLCPGSLFSVCAENLHKTGKRERERKALGIDNDALHILERLFGD